VEACHARHARRLHGRSLASIVSLLSVRPRLTSATLVAVLALIGAGLDFRWLATLRKASELSEQIGLEIAGFGRTMELLEPAGYCATIWMRKSDNQGENL